MSSLKETAFTTFARCVCYSVSFPFPGAFAVGAETPDLPSPDEVQRIWIQPHDDKLKDYFTAESLLEALPHLHRANIGKSVGFGKVWLWQKGIIFLKNGKEIHWKSFADNLILIDTDNGPVFYTDLDSKTIAFADDKIITTIYTWEGHREVIIDMN